MARTKRQIIERGVNAQGKTRIKVLKGDSFNLKVTSAKFVEELADTDIFNINIKNRDKVLANKQRISKYDDNPLSSYLETPVELLPE